MPSVTKVIQTKKGPNGENLQGQVMEIPDPGLAQKLIASGDVAEVGSNPYAKGTPEYSAWETQFGPTKPQNPLPMAASKPKTAPAAAPPAVVPPPAPKPSPAASAAPVATPTAPPALTAPAAPQQGSDMAFQNGVGVLMQKAQTSKEIQDRLFKVIRARFDRDLSTEDIASLPIAVQEAIRRRDDGMLDYTIASLRQEQTGRSTEMSNALNYLVQGHQSDVAAATKRREDAMNSFNKWLTDFGAGLGAAGITQDELQTFFDTGVVSPQLATKLMSAERLKEEIAQKQADAKAKAESEKPMSIIDAVKVAAAAADPEAAWAFLAPLVGMTGKTFAEGQHASTQPGADKVNVGGYDISSYATDPNHEKAVSRILQSMGTLETPDKMTAFMKALAPNTPITAEMVNAAAQKYGVSPEMIIAMMVQDSSLGTKGKAVRTMNPGNVGNTDSGATRTFGSWAEGVDAVAAWLSRHKVSTSDQPTAAALKKAVAGQKLTQQEVNTIADEVIAGRQPPDLKGMYGSAAPIKAALAAKGYDQTQAMLDYTATQKYMGTLNGQQQVRLRQAVDFAYESLDVLDQLNAEWKRGGFGPFNKAQIELAKSGALGQEAQSIATRFTNQTVEMQAELATVYKGGNSPTDQTLSEASKLFDTNWSEATMTDNINLVRQNLKIRQNSIANAGIVKVDATTGAATTTGGGSEGAVATAQPTQADIDYVKSLGL